MINAKLDQVNIELKLYTFLFLTCFTLFWGLYKWTGLGLFSYMAADFVLFMVVYKALNTSLESIIANACNTVGNGNTAAENGSVRNQREQQFGDFGRQGR